MTTLRAERRWLLTFALVLTALVMLPYLVGWASAPTGTTFSGALIGADDFQSYIGKMRLGARSLWDFYLFYTPEAHEPVPLVFLPYIAAGQLVGLFIADTDPALTPALVVTYHAMRVVFNLALIAALYGFIAHFLHSPIQRRVALLLAVLGGGFGWLLPLLPGGAGWLGSLPADLYIPEGFSFLIVLSLPHLALARALLLAGFLALFRALEAPHGWGWAALSGVCWALVGIIVPFYLAVLYCLLAAWGAALWLRERRFPLAFALRGGAAAALTLPLFAYYALAFSRNPVVAAWSAQNLLPAPHPLQYLVAYSLFIAAGAWALRGAWRRGGAWLLLPAWALVGFVLVYLPINVQRRMAEGILVPLAILAAHGLFVGVRRLRRRARRRWVRAYIVVACLTSAVLLLTTTLGALSDAPPVRLPGAEIAAFNWLNAHAPADARVLATMETGNLLPAYTHLRPYVGHGPETLNYEARRVEAERYFADALAPDERAALYASVGIRYVFVGANERALLPDDGTPAYASDGTLIYDADGVRIYQLP